MKGSSFQNGIEFKITIEGESWAQGSPLFGSVEAIARNPGAVAPAMRVVLAEATERKVKAKSENAFDVIESVLCEKSPAKWNFTLAIDARVTDKAGNLYLLYGRDAESLDLFSLGQLKLNIIPHLHLQDFIEVIKNHYRFALKSISASKNNFIEVKFDAPSGDGWRSLESLVLLVKIDDEGMVSTKFQFNRNEVDPTKGGLSSKIVKREITKEFELAKYVHDFNQRLNKDAVTQIIDEVVAEYRAAGWLS